MKTQMKFLLAVAVLNIVIHIYMTQTTDAGDYYIPGVENMTIPYGSDDYLEEYEERFNATTKLEGWKALLYSVPILGDIYAGTMTFWSTFHFLIDGVPSLIDWCQGFIPVETTALDVFKWFFRILTAFMWTTLFIEFISGRQLLD